MEIRLSGYTSYRTEYHIVWIPKYRHCILNPGVKGYLEKLFPKIMEQLPGCEIIKCNIQIDHIHMVMIIPPRYAVDVPPLNDTRYNLIKGGINGPKGFTPEQIINKLRETEIQ